MKILGTFIENSFVIHAFDTDMLSTRNQIDVNVDGIQGTPLLIWFHREAAGRWAAGVDVAQLALPPDEALARHLSEAVVAAAQHASYLQNAHVLLEGFYLEGIARAAQAYEASVAHDPPLGEKGAEALIDLVRSMLKGKVGYRRLAGTSIMYYERGSFKGTEYECYTKMGNRVQWRHGETKEKMPEPILRSMLANGSQRSCLRK